MLGFYQHLITLSEDVIKERFMHLLTVQYTPGYLWGQLKGIPQGIWSWIKDMAEMIWELIKLPYTISKFLFVTVPEELKALYENSQKAIEWFEGNKEVVYKFAKEMITGTGDDMASIADAVKEQIYSMAEGFGSSASSQLVDFAGKSNEEIGVAIGKIEGYILPDIILAVFSEGIGNAIKGGIQSLKVFIEAGRAGAVTLKALEAGKAGVAAIEKFLEGAKIFANKAYVELKTMLRSIIEYVKKLLGFEEKALDTARAAEHVVEEGKAISKLETKADEALKKDAKQHADEVVEEGPDKKSKSGTLYKAIVIAEVADAQNLPIAAAIAELDLLKAGNPKVSFEYDGHDPYRIWMVGSRYLVDGNYTVKSGLPKQREPFADDPDFHENLFEGEHGQGVETAPTEDPLSVEPLESKTRKKAGVSLEETHHIATKYRKANKEALKNAGMVIDDKLNLIKDLPEHGQIRGWYDWKNGKYQFNMRGHHPDYNNWVTNALVKAAPDGIAPELALDRITKIMEQLDQIIRKYPEVLTNGPDILPPNLKILNF